jgi:choice-of-anchor B domain-containing protein
MRFVLALSTLGLSACAFSQFNLNLLGSLNYGPELSSLTGYASGGKEYAIVGLDNGTSIVDITTPATPNALFFVPGPPGIWREMRVWDDYAYVTNETDSGLLIINLSNLPNSITYKKWTGNNGVTFSTIHTIHIDEQGYGYLFGSDAPGTAICDFFTDPWNPSVKTVYNVNYVHDGFVRGDTLWAGQIYAGNFAVVDVSDKSVASIPSSKVLATQQTPSNFTHNCWLTDDGKYLFTTDEVSSAYVTAYDVSDLSDIKEVDRVQHNPGSGSIPHNTYVVNGNFLVTAYYRDGVTIHDATHPDNIIEMGYYDTSPLSGNGFNGVWGVYAYLPSGNIIASDMEEGLFILGPTYQQACYLEGNVTDSLSTFPISGADVTITTAAYANTSSNITGDYKTGFQAAGLYDVTFSKVGYYPKTVTGVSASHGVITTLNVILKPQIPFSTTGTVRDSVTGAGISGAEVLLVTTDTSYTAACDASGMYTVPAMFEGWYDVYAGSWGHMTRQQTAYLTGNGVDFDLPQGYYDDFILDLGWVVTGNAATGLWERGEPAGTTNGGSQSNPDVDVAGDFGDKAYVTGNAGGAAPTDDVDNGRTVLTSPQFDLTSYLFPAINFHRWFYNGGGAGGPNDSLTIRLHNGTSSVIIDLALNNDPDESDWSQKRIEVSDHLTPTASMSLTVETGDLPASGHLVEGGFDLFFVFDSLHAPVADFSADVLTGCAPLTVHFTDASQQAQTWQWQMPGSVEGTSTDQNPTATYPAAGIYEVTLIVTNISGSDSVTKSTYITVLEAPESTMSTTADDGSGNGTATATPIAGEAPYTYAWSDGQTTQTASGLIGGWYSVTVTDVNGCGYTDSVFVVTWMGLNQPELTWTISPNPAHSVVRVTFDGDVSQIRARLYGLNGQLIRTWEAVGSVLVIELPEAAGAYLLQLRDEHDLDVRIKLLRID